MKNVSCYNCRPPDSSFYASENGFNLMKCCGCGLLYVNPRPNDEEIREAHELGEHGGARTLNVTETFVSSKIPTYLKVLSDIYEDGRALAGTTWLDIGCGHGEFLCALKEFTKGKIVARGIEPNGYKQQSARSRQLDVSYFDLDKHESKYDVISLLNVYSHLPDPIASLGNWKRLLNNNGEMLFETGDTANFPSADHYRPFCLPDHLSFPSEEIVLDVLRRVGFQVVCVRKYPFITRSISRVVKEIAKIVWPGKHSRLKYLSNAQVYAETDMYVRAVLMNS